MYKKALMLSRKERGGTWNFMRIFFSNLKDRMRKGAVNTVPMGKNG